MQMPGMNPQMMKKIMKQLKAEEIDASEVVIKTGEGNLIIKNPQVVKMTVSGVPTFQVVGDAKLEEEGVNPDDVKLVMENSGCSEDEAIEALAEAKGDIAQAIMNLKE
jgi:nascent polypeptide-associated complex subunit alpha